MATIEARDLVKLYGHHRAVDGISFSIESGEVVGFLGPNGAGKTTTMRLLTGFLAPTAGLALVDGVDVLKDPVAAQRRLGYLPESAPVYRDMRVSDFLDFVARVRGMARAERVAAVERVARLCGLTERFYQVIGSLSKGYRQRVGLAQALVHGPGILVLDEPTSGLDPNQIIDIRNLIREIGRSKTVILSTHILIEVQATCDRVLIIHQGRLVADGSTEEIKARQQGGQIVNVTFVPGKVQLSQERISQLLSCIPGVEHLRDLEVAEPEGMGFQVTSSQDVRAEIFALAAGNGLVILELAREISSLEDVFQRLTTGDRHLGAAPQAVPPPVPGPS